MLFILDKLKDLWENSCRRRRPQLRLNCKLKAYFLFDNGDWSRSWRNVIKISQLEIYWNTCRFLFVLPLTTRIPYFPLESDTMEMKRREVAVAGDTVLPGQLCSFECNILQVSLFLFPLFFSICLSTSASLVAPGMRWTLRVLCVISLTFPCSLWFS